VRWSSFGLAGNGGWGTSTRAAAAYVRQYGHTSVLSGPVPVMRWHTYVTTESLAALA
jgi:hypothetical protein